MIADEILVPAPFFLPLDPPGMQNGRQVGRTLERSLQSDTGYTGIVQGRHVEPPGGDPLKTQNRGGGEGVYNGDIEICSLFLGFIHV